MNVINAIAEIEEALEYGCGDYINNQALYEALAALEKQIPKKPKFYDTKFRQRGLKYGEHTTIEKAYNCPSCNCTVWGTDEAEYCNHCGQALDWSDEE